MIKHTELRCGNLIKAARHYDLGSQDDKTLFGVRQIGEGGIKIFRDGGLSEWNDLRIIDPIPLTEEWLLMAGFEMKGQFVNKMRLTGNPPASMDGSILFFLDRSDENETSVFMENGKFYYEVAQSGDEIEDTYHTIEVEFVHRLQNLHFAFTNEELNFNFQSSGERD